MRDFPWLSEMDNDCKYESEIENDKDETPNSMKTELLLIYPLEEPIGDHH